MCSEYLLPHTIYTAQENNQLSIKEEKNFQLNYNYELFQLGNKVLIRKAEICRVNYLSQDVTPQFAMCVCVMYEREIGTLELVQDISPDTKFLQQR